jgi:hypothetical protein
VASRFSVAGVFSLGRARREVWSAFSGDPDDSDRPHLVQAPGSEALPRRAETVNIGSKESTHMNADIDPGARDFRFGVTGVGLMVAAAVILMIVG